MSTLFMRKHGRRLAKLGAAACIILATIALTRIARATLLDHQVKNMTAELNKLKMKTICVGRFLIDVPADAEVSYRGAMIAGWSIGTYDDETDEQFAARVKKKEDELLGQKNGLGMPSLESVHSVDKNGVRGKIHVYGRRWIHGLPNEKPDQNVRIEAMIRAQKHSFNLTIEYSDDKDLKELAQLVTQFRARAENEIPTEAGYCFDGGFIAEPITVEQRERTTMFVGLKGHPDVSIMLDMTAGITTPETLLQRAAENDKEDENRSRWHTFRRGPRPFNGEPGEELLERVQEFNGNYGHSFMWELVHNKTGNVFTPDMSLEMTTGNGQPGTTVDSSLSDAEALALWDKLLSSLRVRPVVKAKPVALAPVQVPLGTLVHANERCPQTGWWECADGDDDIAILGGRRQYYREGDCMAQAIQLAPTTLWQRLSRQRPSFTSKLPTPWKLVSLRQQPRSDPAVVLRQSSPAPLDDGTGASALPPDAEHDALTPPPGTMADSGMACPASGWWRCAAAHALDGTRWFGRGQTLPVATVQQQLSILARFKGAPEVAHHKTPWQFVRPDDRAKIASSERAATDDSNDTTA
jgi:hypothetical protein